MRLVKARRHGVDRRQAPVECAGDEMGDDLGVGLGLEDVAIGLQFRPQLAEILDDAVMDDRELGGGMRMGVGLVGLAMRRPAGVPDADQPFERFAGQADLQILELALGAAAGQQAMLQRGDAG